MTRPELISFCHGGYFAVESVSLNLDADQLLLFRAPPGASGLVVIRVNPRDGYPPRSVESLQSRWTGISEPESACVGFWDPDAIMHPRETCFALSSRRGLLCMTRVQVVTGKVKFASNSHTCTSPGRSWRHKQQRPGSSPPLRLTTHSDV